MDALLSDSFRVAGRSTVETRPVHIFFHLPRCAGQTIYRHLSSHAPAGTYFRVRKRKGASRIFVPKYSVSEMPDPGELNAISGHWVGDSIVRKFPDRPIARSILLRDPVSQFISHYNFRMMRYLSVGLRPYPIEIAYRARRRNFMTHFILRTFAETPWWRLRSLSAAEKCAAADEFLSSFYFVGDHTRCNELIATLAPDLGVPINAEQTNTSEQWLRHVDWKPLDAKDLPGGMLDRIKQDNMLDQHLWETWKDAGTNGGDAHRQPHIFSDDGLMMRIAVQSSRFANQVRRRVNRRWSSSGPRPGIS